MGLASIVVVATGCAAGGSPEPPAPMVASLGVDDDDDGDWSSGPEEDTDGEPGETSGGDTTGPSPLPPGDTTAGEEPEPETTTGSGCVGDCVETCIGGTDDDGDGDVDCDDADCADHLACTCVVADDLVHGLHVLCSDPTTWTEARDACEDSGMHLVSIDDAAHNQWLVARAMPLSAISWWMGYSDLTAEGVWTWVDGAPVTYENWYPGEPNNGVSAPEHCAAFPEHTATAWNDLSCDALHPFICEL